MFHSEELIFILDCHLWVSKSCTGVRLAFLQTIIDIDSWTISTRSKLDMVSRRQTIEIVDLSGWPLLSWSCEPEHERLITSNVLFIISRHNHLNEASDDLKIVCLNHQEHVLEAVLLGFQKHVESCDRETVPLSRIEQLRHSDSVVSREEEP